MLAVDTLHDLDAALVREPALGDHLINEGGVVGHALRAPPDVPPWLLALRRCCTGVVVPLRAGNEVSELKHDEEAPTRL